MRNVSRRRLASTSTLTAGLYLAGTLWCLMPQAGHAAPARIGPRPLSSKSADPTAGDASSATGGIQSGPSRLNQPKFPGDSRTRIVVSYPQEEVIAPKEYVVGPGDIMDLHFWGRMSFSVTLNVDPQGRIFIPDVGFVEGAGRTLEEVTTAVLARARKTYPRLKAGLSLVKPRSFVIHVAGLVRFPGPATVTPLTRVSDAVRKSGGCLKGGSQAHIQVRRGGGTLQADLQQFYLTGDRTHNPRLLEGDVIQVPPIQMEAEISGAVLRPGAYELSTGATIRDLVALAGGLAVTASKELPVHLVRRTPKDRLGIRWLASARDPKVNRERLYNGDKVFVPAVAEMQASVTVQGAIAVSPAERAAAGADRRMDNPAAGPREFTSVVPFYEGDTTRTVFGRSGGLLPWADAKRAVVQRKGKDGKLVRIPFDAHALLALRDLKQDIPLQAGDIIYVPALREAVMVAGPVYRPGLYQHNPSFSALDYIKLAGGPTPNGSLSGSQVITSNGVKLTGNEEALVAPGDTVVVDRKALTTFEWVQILLTLSSIALSATAIALTVR